jgi:hypothetical protein
MAFQSGLGGDRRSEDAGGWSRGDAAELAAFGVGVLALGTTASIVPWRVLALGLGGR